MKQKIQKQSITVSSQEEWQRAFNPYIAGSNPA